MAMLNNQRVGFITDLPPKSQATAAGSAFRRATNSASSVLSSFPFRITHGTNRLEMKIICIHVCIPPWSIKTFTMQSLKIHGVKTSYFYGCFTCSSPSHPSPSHRIALASSEVGGITSAMADVGGVHLPLAILVFDGGRVCHLPSGKWENVRDGTHISYYHDMEI